MPARARNSLTTPLDARITHRTIPLEQPPLAAHCPRQNAGAERDLLTYPVISTMGVLSDYRRPMVLNQRFITSEVCDDNAQRAPYRITS